MALGGGGVEDVRPLRPGITLDYGEGGGDMTGLQALIPGKAAV